MLRRPFSPFAAHHTGRVCHANAADLACPAGLPLVTALLGNTAARDDPAPGGALGSIITSDATRYYESIDLEEARHEQTILAYEINDRALPVEYGAPLRLRVERQLGYKMAKFVMRLELVSSFAALGEGRGGYGEERGYEWYAGI